MSETEMANKRQSGNPPDSVTGFLKQSKPLENWSFLIVIQSFWRLCSAAMLPLLLLYWLYGGITTFLLLTAAVLGVLYFYQDALLYFPDQPESSRIFVQTPHKFGLPFSWEFLCQCIVMSLKWYGVVLYSMICAWIVFYVIANGTSCSIW